MVNDLSILLFRFDIRFTKGDGVTLLPYLSILLFRFPGILADTSTMIHESFNSII